MIYSISWDEFPSWFKRKRYPFFRDWFFEDIDEVMKDMERMMEESLRRFTDKAPNREYILKHTLCYLDGPGGICSNIGAKIGYKIEYIFSMRVLYYFEF